jgi:hypothetical protein
VRSTPNRRTVCIWFGLRPHSLDSHPTHKTHEHPALQQYWGPHISDHSSGVFGLVCECITNPYRILCPRCERAWCIWFGPPATYQSLPASTCKEGWILVWWARPLPGVTMRYHVAILSLHRPLTFTSHHLRPDTQTDTHMEHTRIEHSTE